MRVKVFHSHKYTSPRLLTSRDLTHKPQNARNNSLQFASSPDYFSHTTRINLHHYHLHHHQHGLLRFKTRPRAERYSLCQQTRTTKALAQPQARPANSLQQTQCSKQRICWQSPLTTVLQRRRHVLLWPRLACIKDGWSLKWHKSWLLFACCLL